MHAGVLLHHLGAFGQPVARNHAAGELLEALLEHALAPVGGEHLVVEGEPVERGKAVLRNALGGGFLLEIGDEAVEAALVIALRGQRRRGGDEHGAGDRGGDKRDGALTFVMVPCLGISPFAADLSQRAMAASAIAR